MLYLYFSYEYNEKIKIMLGSGTNIVGGLSKELMASGEVSPKLFGNVGKDLMGGKNPKDELTNNYRQLFNFFSVFID